MGILKFEVVDVLAFRVVTVVTGLRREVGNFKNTRFTHVLWGVRVRWIGVIQGLYGMSHASDRNTQKLASHLVSSAVFPANMLLVKQSPSSSLLLFLC